MTGAEPIPPSAPRSTSRRRESDRRPSRCSRAAFPPGPTDQLADAVPDPGVPDDDEDPRLEVLGTRGMGGGAQAQLDEFVADRLVGELAAGALAEHDVEERLRSEPLRPRQPWEQRSVINRSDRSRRASVPARS